LDTLGHPANVGKDLEGFSKPWGYHMLRLISLVMLLCTVVVCFSSVIFFGHIKSYFLKNKVILSSFLGHKNGPKHQELKMAKFLRIGYKAQESGSDS